MVKVWYEPPPYGVGTSLNRPPYGTADTGAKWLQKLARVPQWQVMTAAVGTVMVLSYIPLSKIPNSLIVVAAVHLVASC
jgi:hypothetical protein